MSSFSKELCFSLKNPLQEGDSEKTTYGCRHSNPDICGSCYLENICAFSSKDNICKKPSASWKRFYKKLLEENQNDK